MTAIVFVSMGLNNFGGQAWVSWMSDLVPPRVRGKFFARRSRMGTAMIAIATLIVAAILDLSGTHAVENLLAPLADRGHLPTLQIVLLSFTFIAAACAIGMSRSIFLLFIKSHRAAHGAANPQAPQAQ